ncbi:hypothetical protein ACTID9_23210 [Brevibacillus fluminis]|uniref:hypothetical protein n=1 Tax=Brevibacillus fluminis TaxID=511487 RepID=UPI003F8A35D0
MFEEINQQLADLKLRIRQKLNWEHNVQQMRSQHKQEADKRDRLLQKLRNEQQDVDRLTGISFGAFFYSMIGKKEEKLAKEKEELLQARLKYEVTADTVKELEDEIQALEEKLHMVHDLESEMAEKLAHKERLILALRPELGTRLRELTHRETDLQAHRKEVQEAIVAGRSAVAYLDRAIKQLESASSWGAWDMLGGGMISTAIKHNRIDEARSAIHSAQKSLRKFQQELKDVQRESAIRIDIGDMLTFADFFFDNIITDWIVQDRISTSLAQAREKRKEVSALIGKLNEQAAMAEKELGQTRQAWLDLIENTV